MIDNHLSDLARWLLAVLLRHCRGPQGAKTLEWIRGLLVRDGKRVTMRTMKAAVEELRMDSEYVIGSTRAGGNGHPAGVWIPTNLDEREVALRPFLANAMSMYRVWRRQKDKRILPPAGQREMFVV